MPFLGVLGFFGGIFAKAHVTKLFEEHQEKGLSRRSLAHPGKCHSAAIQFQQKAREVERPYRTLQGPERAVTRMARRVHLQETHRFVGAKNQVQEFLVDDVPVEKT